MKNLIFLIAMLIITPASASKWNCKDIPGTKSIVKIPGCSSYKLCMGYASCKWDNDKETTGRVICKSDRFGKCPDANQCMTNYFDKAEISISVLPDNNRSGLHRFCDSKNNLEKGSKNVQDVVFSRFCNNVSGPYMISEDLPSQMTNKDGGGAQTASKK